MYFHRRNELDKKGYDEAAMEDAIESRTSIDGHYRVNIPKERLLAEIEAT